MRATPILVVTISSLLSGCGALQALVPCEDDLDCRGVERCEEGACVPRGFGGDGGVTGAPGDGGVFDLPLALHSVHPPVARQGDVVTLEGAFSGEVRVEVPGAGELVVDAGPRAARLHITVPAGATAGELRVARGEERAGPVSFTATRFSPRLGALMPHMEQDGAARELPPLATPRAGHVVVARGRYLYAIGGRSALGGTATVERARVYADDSLAPFKLTETLQRPREDAAFAVVGQRLYVIGGASQGGLLPDLEVATFDEEGNLSAFSFADVNLMTPRAGAAAVVVGRHLYVIGGRSPGGEVATLERAPILEDGALGAFESVPFALQSPRSGHTVEVIGEHLYVLGGGEADPAGIERAALDDAGDLVEGFVRSGELPTPRSFHRSARIGGEVCVIGGLEGPPSSTTPASSIACAPLLAEPPLGLFADTPRALRHPRSRHALALVGQRLYVVGGDAPGPAGGLEQARLDSGAGFTGFAPLDDRALGTARRAATCAVIGDYLYVVGGTDGQRDLRSIERARVAPDGSLAPFEPHHRLGSARRALRLAVLRDHVYAVGGAQASSQLTSVSAATVLEDGSLAGDFAPHSTLGTARMGSALAVIGEHLYAVGGRSNNGDERSTEYASIEPSELGRSWSSGPDLGADRAFHAVVTLGERLYVLGGRDGGNFLSTVSTAPFVVDARVARIDGFADFGSFAAQRATHSALVAGGALWLVGGANQDSQVTTVERASVEDSGALSTAFSPVGDMVPGDAVANGCVVRLGGYVYLIGGANELAGAPSSKIYRAVLE